MSENFLKKIREAKGISQIDLAGKVGIARSHLSNFESGKVNLSAKVLTRISKILGVDVSEIKTGKPDSQFDPENKEKLLKAMIITNEIYGDNFDKEMIVSIATEVYTFIKNADSIDDEDDKESFQKLMKSKYIAGLAANCVLKMKS
jgi:transcriptional regulator with XRE-family HTH domain